MNTLGQDSMMEELLDVKKIGYKVVSRKNSKSFKPATDSALQRITYRLNRETRQARDEYGPFAIFETLEQAEGFYAKYGDNILKVEYEPSGETELWKKLPPTWVGGKHGHLESNGTIERPIDLCPGGTILTSSVYVLEIVK